MKILNWLKRLIPRPGPQELTPEEMRKRWEDMQEKIKLAKSKGKNVIR